MRCAAIVNHAVVTIASIVNSAGAQVVVFEAEGLFPEEHGWDRLVECEPDRWIADGVLYQTIDAICDPPPFGERDRYSRAISEFTGRDIFAEARMMTDGPSSEMPGGGPTAFVFGNLLGISYDLRVARDDVRYCWDTSLPCLHIPLKEGVMHTFRLEIEGPNWYRFFVDGELMSEGVPEGDLITLNPSMVFSASSWQLSSNTQWDYVRYGVLQTPASGDFDTSGTVDEFDQYYFEECLGNSGTDVDAGPGCAWADMDSDTDVDCDDWIMFEAAWTAGGFPPIPQLCLAQIPTVSEWGLAVTGLLTLTIGTIILHRTKTYEGQV